jgi:hypothetical protein
MNTDMLLVAYTGSHKHSQGNLRSRYALRQPSCHVCVYIYIYIYTLNICVYIYIHIFSLGKVPVLACFEGCLQVFM